MVKMLYLGNLFEAEDNDGKVIVPSTEQPVQHSVFAPKAPKTKEGEDRSPFFFLDTPCCPVRLPTDPFSISSIRTDAQPMKVHRPAESRSIGCVEIKLQKQMMQSNGFLTYGPFVARVIHIDRSVHPRNWHKML